MIYMALLDISLVTQALINLIHFSFKTSKTWNPSGTSNSPDVLPVPPVILNSESVSLYLCHIKEESAFRNLQTPENNFPSIKYAPLGLSLYYQLTAHSNLQTGQSTLNEQKMIGIAVKAFHDYPLIDSSTKIEIQDNLFKVFPDALCAGNNRFKILMLPISLHESINYWTNSGSPLRLVVYYQVSVVEVDEN
jgi:hypothetical protein